MKRVALAVGCSIVVAAVCLRAGQTRPGATSNARIVEQEHREAKLYLPVIPVGRLSSCVQDAVQRHVVCGATVLVQSRNAVPYIRSFGCDLNGHTIERDTIFDAASLTKVMVTAPITLSLVANGKLTLETPIRRWFPSFDAEKGAITVGQLLMHTSGLPAGPDRILVSPPEESIAHIILRRRPGEKFEYSDLGYILLGRIVEIETGERLDRAADRLIFRPAGMNDTRFLPPAILVQRIASTRGEHNEILCGSVQDPLARQIGGVAGHAGLFTTAADIARYGDILLHRGALGSRQILSPVVVRYLTEPVSIDPRTTRSYGMDVLSLYSSPKGDLLPFGSFGHTGFTGCSFWLDPESGAEIVLMSTGVTEKTRKELGLVRRTVATIVAGEMK